MDEYGDEVEKLILTHGKTYVDKRLMENTLGLVGGWRVRRKDKETNKRW